MLTSLEAEVFPSFLRPTFSKLTNDELFSARLLLGTLARDVALGHQELSTRMAANCERRVAEGLIKRPYADAVLNGISLMAMRADFGYDQYRKFPDVATLLGGIGYAFSEDSE